VLLDGRKVHTPAKAQLCLPSRPLAEAIAAEWQAQEEVIAPLTMPFTRSANAAIDKVTPQFAEVAQLVAAYGETDLLCYRATGPEALVARQSERWDPLLDWAATVLGARLQPTSGVMHRAQNPDSLAALSAFVLAQDAFALTALHDLVAISGSLVIGLAALRQATPAEELWLLSRLDEHWQQELWGTDEEAAEVENLKKRDFLHAARFFALSRT
ncbi:ATPase, partial [Thioclava sp. BHET1]